MVGSVRIDRLGALFTVVGAAALAFLPFVVFKQNRILPGDALGLSAVLTPRVAWGCLAALAATALVATCVRDARVRFGAALLAIIIMASAVAAAGNALTPPGNRVVRVAPGAGSWLLLAALALMATDALARLRPRPLTRVLLL
ncbi:MAG: ABC transporter permease, partial [Gammaproteobacteria bacterium]|nr:ABC transporter permease [Gammaproteobacteria bacterium]